MDGGHGRERLYRRFVAEEIASSFRHHQVNKIAAVGALTFHLRRQLPAETTPAAALGVLPLIDAELSQATQALDRRFIEPAARTGPVALGTLVDGLLASLDRPPAVELVGPRGPGVRAAIDLAELDLALFCLVENALEAVAAGGTVTVGFPTVQERGTAMIEVADDGPGLPEAERRLAPEPFRTTKPGRLGLGLAVANRIAQRWRGQLALMAGARAGLVARLTLPAVAP